jgi:hypothetical protein
MASHATGACAVPAGSDKLARITIGPHLDGRGGSLSDFTGAR